jgi:hypothetical protein
VTVSFQVEGFGPDSPRGLVLLRAEGARLNSEGRLEVAPGEQISGVRLVVTQATGIVRGQVKVIGGTLPDDVRLIVSAYRNFPEVRRGTGGQVDARGLFTIEGLLPGDYLLHIGFSGSVPQDQNLMTSISRAKQLVSVAAEAETPVTLTIDLTRGKNP